MRFAPPLDTLLLLANMARVAGIVALLGIALAVFIPAVRRVALHSRPLMIIVMMSLCAAAGAIVIFPKPNYPSPTGPFAVGEALLGADSLGMTGREAADLAGAARPDAPRPAVRVWYPAGTAPAGSAAGGSAPARAGAAGAANTTPLTRLWNRLRRDTASADTAIPDLPMVAGVQRFPVVIYYPGWPGTRIENFALICDLASHGYVVAGVVYPARAPGVSDAQFEQQVRALERPMDYSSEAAYHRTVQAATERVRLRARDAISLLDGLTRLDAMTRLDDLARLDAAAAATRAAAARTTAAEATTAAGGARARGLFAQRLDLSKVAIVGFSLGGAVAAEASTLDPRFKAAVNMDGRHWGTALADGVSQPYLFIGEELLQPSAADLSAADPDRRFNAILDQHDYAQLALNLRRNGGTQVIVSGTEHMNFTDSALLSRFRHLTFTGRINARRAMDIVNAYVVAFVEQTLAGKPSALLLEGARPFPEARIEVWRQ